MVSNVQEESAIEASGLPFLWACETENILVNFSKKYAKGETPIKIIVTDNTSENSEYFDFVSSTIGPCIKALRAWEKSN